MSYAAKIANCVLILVVSVLAKRSLLHAQESSAAESLNATTASIYAFVPQFGGPTSVGGQIVEDAAVPEQYRWQGLQDAAEPWYQLKQRIDDRRGLQFNVDHSSFFQVATQSAGESQAASGLFRFYGQWEPLRNAGHATRGMLVFKVEDRHRMGTRVTPFELGFEAGSAVPTGTFFNEFPFAATNLFWKQYLCDGEFVVATGRIDVTDFIDVYAMMNPLTHFINLAFSTNPTIAVPNQGLGIALGGMLTDHVYFQGGMADANGQSTHAGFNTFFDDAEYFSYVEFGTTTSQDRLFVDNVHVTLWHTDARRDAGTPSGHGVSCTAQRFIDDRLLPFFRFGYADGDASLMQTTFSGGLGIARKNRDVCGVGVSWGKPAVGGRDQFTSECFYRLQVTQYLAVTPDAQLIFDPAFNPALDSLALFGIRLRAVF